MAEDATEIRIPKVAARKHIAGRLRGSDLLIIVTLFSLLLVRSVVLPIHYSDILQEMDDR